MQGQMITTRQRNRSQVEVNKNHQRLAGRNQWRTEGTDSKSSRSRSKANREDGVNVEQVEVEGDWIK